MVLGVEIGGTKLQAGICDQRGRVHQLARWAVERRAGRAGILRQLGVILPGILRAYPVRAIGVGFGGPVDSSSGRVVKSHQIAGWTGFALRDWFRKKFRRPVVVENDSNCAALAEAVLGAGCGKEVVFYTNVGTGIGGGLVIGGRLYNRQYGAMEIGHTRLVAKGGRNDRASWRTVESLASGLAIESGRSTMRQSAQIMGVAVANVITLLNPDVVVIGGGVALEGAPFFRPLRKTVAQTVFAPFRRNCRIVPAALGENVVVVGAALLAAGRKG